MKSALIIGLGVAATVACALTGCSKSVSQDVNSATSAVTSATDAVKGNPPPGKATVTINGVDQNAQGAVVCSSLGGTTRIAVGDAGQGLAVQLTDTDPPQVTMIAGVSASGGKALAYGVGAPGGSASATKDGSTYKITGTTAVVDPANPGPSTNQSFDIAITCP